MKKKTIFSIISVVLVITSLFIVGCTKSDVDRARDDYNWNNIEPMILNFTGPTDVAASGLTPLPYSVAHRGGSSYEWTTYLYGATIEVPDPNLPNEVMVTWNQSSVDTVGYLICVETTFAGKKSAPDSLKVTLKKFCPLQNGANDLVGDWGGVDAYYYASTVHTTAIDDESVYIDSLGIPFIEDWWGEPVVEKGTLKMMVDNEGFVTIPRQYAFTTVWEGDNYRYEIKGEGQWENCDATPVLHLIYDIYYEGGYGIGAEYGVAYMEGNPYLTAELTMKASGKSLELVPVSKKKTISQEVLKELKKK